MSPTGSVRIWWDTNLGGYRMISPYNQGFVDLLKAAIPGSDRSWDGTSKTWSFTDKYLSGVIALSEKVFGTKATVITREQAEKATTPPSVGKATVITVAQEFMSLIPYESAQRAYKHAAALFHPDHGGDMEKMSRLNALWQRLEKELYKKE